MYLFSSIIIVLCIVSFFPYFTTGIITIILFTGLFYFLPDHFDHTEKNKSKEPDLLANQPDHTTYKEKQAETIKEYFEDTIDPVDPEILQMQRDLQSHIKQAQIREDKTLENELFWTNKITN